MASLSHLEQEIDETVRQAMQTWNVPGLALAIVKDDQVLLARGYGVREIDKPEPVDAHTLFAIGSNTKAFTATAVGLLVQEGKLAWDDPVTKYLPAFKLYDDFATRLITIRDLLCHRSGLGTWAGDVLLYSDYAIEDIVDRVRHIPLAFSFRAGYGYSNLMFITAGLVLSTISGLSWDEFIQQRLFAPLGITNSVTHPRFFGDRSNIATPHEDLQGRLQTVSYNQDRFAGASGSIYASVSDIACWLRLQINQGSLDGRQIVDPAIIAETHTPHNPIRLGPPDAKLFPTRLFAAYGLGWFLSDEGSRFTVRHTGGVDGMLSSTALVPGEKLGVAVFTNKLPNSAFSLLTNYLIDKMTGRASRNWFQLYAELEQETQQKAAQAKQQRLEARVTGTRPAFPLERYAGDYTSAILGGASLRVAGDGLCIQLQVHPTVTGSLQHWHYDTFLCTWDNPVLGESLIPFLSDGQGQVVELRVKIREDWIDPLEHVFHRVS